MTKGGEGGFKDGKKQGNVAMTLLLKSTLRLLGINAGACLRHELKPRGSGLTLSGAFHTALKGRSLAPPNGSIKDPARLEWHEVKKVDHYYLSIDAVTQPMQVREGGVPYGDREKG